MIGGWEILLILGALLLLFGGRRLPELARNLGKGMREFKKASKGLSDEIDVTGEIKDVKPSDGE